MHKRYVSIWFSHLKTDWFCKRHPSLSKLPFVLKAPSRGRMLIVHANAKAQQQGIQPGMVLADAKAMLPSLQVLDDQPDLALQLLKKIGEWCIRFTPFVSINATDGLILDATGCTHLWGGDEAYVTEIAKRIKTLGYTVRVSIADTIGAAWAVARYGKEPLIIEKGNHVAALAALPPEALRIEIDTIERLHKLGLKKIENLLSIPRSSLSRRFGKSFLTRMKQAIGIEEELVQPIYPVENFCERLTSLEPIVTATGIEIALRRLLDTLCERLRRQAKGLRLSRFICYRIDGKVQTIEIVTGSPSHNEDHLFKLFEIKLPTIEPALGIEVFVLEAKNVEEKLCGQIKIWGSTGLVTDRLSELLDRISMHIGANCIHRYLPDEHHLPEKSFKQASSLAEKTMAEWKLDRPRPIEILSRPEQIEVTAPIPDYPPMLFRYKGKLHKIIKADGPERIEQEWWIANGRHRDYYSVEDEEGNRYWLFRSGHYNDNKKPNWFIHGFFA